MRQPTELRPALLATAFILLAGCSTVSREAVFSDVQKIVQERSTYTPEYSGAEQEVQKLIETNRRVSQR